MTNTVKHLVLLLVTSIGLVGLSVTPSLAHLTDPQGCELLIVKSPDRRLALSAGLSDDQTTFNYGFDTNSDGRVDLIVGYQVVPQAQWVNPQTPGYLPNPVAYWKDADGDGKPEHLFLPGGGQYEDCRWYIHLQWDGTRWILYSQPHRNPVDKPADKPKPN